MQCSMGLIVWRLVLCSKLCLEQENITPQGIYITTASTITRIIYHHCESLCPCPIQCDVGFIAWVFVLCSTLGLELGGGLIGYVKSRPLGTGQIISIDVLVDVMIIAVFHKKLI